MTASKTDRISLDVAHEAQLCPAAPFNFDGTLHKPSHFPSSDGVFESGSFWQSMRFAGRMLGLRLCDRGSTDAPRLAITVFSDCQLPDAVLKQVLAELDFRLDLSADISPLYTLAAKDALLEPAVNRWRGMRVCASVSLYEFLIVSTVLQNATVRRSVQMLENLFQRFGAVVEFDGKVVSGFWSPETLCMATEDELRALKLGYRAKTFLRQAGTFLEEDLDEVAMRALGSEDLKTKLLELYGVGPASVWYLMFEVFKRYDCLDYLSPWEQRIYSRILFEEELVDSEIILQEVKTRWGAWRMLAAHYLFEDLFWRRKNDSIPWLDELIRL